MFFPLVKCVDPQNFFSTFVGLSSIVLKKVHFKTCHPDGDEAGNLYFHDGLGCDFETEWATSVRS